MGCQLIFNAVGLLSVICQAITRLLVEETMTASVRVQIHLQTRIDGTQIFVKHAMIQAYAHFKILLTYIFLLFIPRCTMLKVNLHTDA